MREDNNLFINIYDSRENNVITRNIEDYIKELVAYSMPLSFHIEALKCQSIIMRTNVMRYLKSKGVKKPNNIPNAIPLSLYPEWKPLKEYRTQWGEDYEERVALINNAVEDTSGKIILFNEKPIDARYHTVCGGATENSENVTGNVVLYLRRVLCCYCQDSPYELSYKDIPIEEVEEKLGVRFSQENCTKNMAIENMLYDIDRDETGRIRSLKIAGREFDGIEMMRRLGLDSTRFSWRPQFIRFLTKGKGDGLGLCQYGANQMAKEGTKAEDILTYYYTGVEIKKFMVPCIKKPLLGKVLVIDAAHGGELGEDHVSEKGTRERDLNLAIAKYLEERLLALGAAVHMTRREDIYVPITERAILTNDIKPNFFLSIHQNYLRNSNMSGTEIYYYRGDLEAKNLAEIILENMSKLELSNRGVKTADFFLLRDIKVSGLHIEVGYLSNLIEERRLLQENFKRDIGYAIADAIASYYQLNL